MDDRFVKLVLAAFMVSSFACAAIAATPGSEDYQKATELIGKKSFQDALPLLDKAIQDNPKHAEAERQASLSERADIRHALDLDIGDLLLGRALHRIDPEMPPGLQ